jgi:hypothetical protein
MKPLLLLFLVVSLSAHAQAPAVRPPARPVTPPALTPGYNPNTPPDPVYTPPGTGLPEVGQPGTHAVPVKRSPNTRALPDEFDPKREPGIWAADGAPRASDAPRLFDVVIPFPSDDPGATMEAKRCADGLVEAADDIRKTKAIGALPEPVRRCLAARAYYHCAAEEELVTQKMMRSGQASYLDRLRQQSGMRAHAERLRAEWCAGVTLDGAAQKALRDVLNKWDEYLRRSESR